MVFVGVRVNGNILKIGIDYFLARFRKGCSGEFGMMGLKLTLILTLLLHEMAIEISEDGIFIHEIFTG